MYGMYIPMPANIKKAYDQLREEVKYCNEIQNTPQPRDNFVYCDRILEKFKDLAN